MFSSNLFFLLKIKISMYIYFMFFYFSFLFLFVLLIIGLDIVQASCAYFSSGRILGIFTAIISSLFLLPLEYQDSCHSFATGTSPEMTTQTKLIADWKSLFQPLELHIDSIVPCVALRVQTTRILNAEVMSYISPGSCVWVCLWF